jgi:adenine phosphoribosyltransferase
VSNSSADVAAARSALLAQFRWEDGHADVWSVFRDAGAFAAVLRGLIAPFRDAGITAVAGIESRGFLLGGACAAQLGVGFVPIRKSGTLFPGAKLRGQTDLDYRGNVHELQMQQASVSASDRILLIDDWIETGNQARVAKSLIDSAGGELVAVSVLVDQLARDSRTALPPVSALVAADELPPEE